MNELTKAEMLTIADCKKIDAAEDGVSASNLKLCRVMAQMPEKQLQIAVYTGRSSQTVSQMIKVGDQFEKYASSIYLPEGWRALYSLSDLTETEIELLCKDKKPTQKAIIYYKEHGELMPATMPAKKKVVATADPSETKTLEQISMLVSPKDLAGLSEFGQHSLMKLLEKIQPLLDEVNKTVGSKVMKLLVLILEYQQTVFNTRLVQEAKKAVKEEKERMDRREKRLVAREKAVSQGLPDKERKLILSVLHPDKAPAGQESRYAKAFDVFRKVS